VVFVLHVDDAADGFSVDEDAEGAVRVGLVMLVSAIREGFGGLPLGSRLGASRRWRCATGR
jgi:hypothetical protein